MRSAAEKTADILEKIAGTGTEVAVEESAKSITLQSGGIRVNIAKQDGRFPARFSKGG